MKLLLRKRGWRSLLQAGGIDPHIPIYPSKVNPADSEMELDKEFGLQVVV